MTGSKGRDPQLTSGQCKPLTYIERISASTVESLRFLEIAIIEPLELAEIPRELSDLNSLHNANASFGFLFTPSRRLD